MNSKIKDILDKIEDNGFEAYVVGGYVRDYLLSKNTYDVDICTNALPKDLISILGSNKVSEYGVFKIKLENYNFDITTYRKEISYSNRKPVKIEYINNLLLDIERRDFTINAICMNKNGTIIDLLGGINDLKNRKIKAIGDVNIKFKEDPLRILRAIRFAVTLDFRLDKSVVKGIKKHKKLIKTLSYTRKKQELDKILSSEYVLKGLNLLKKFGLLELLEIRFKKIVAVNDLCGMYAQLDISDNYSFTKNELNNIKRIKKIVENGKIDNNILFKEGLYISGVAGDILGIDKALITKNYETLAIHSIKDICITSEEIILLLKIKPSKIISNIYEDLVKEILNNDLRNDYESLRNYILDNERKWL